MRKFGNYLVPTRRLPGDRDFPREAGNQIEKLRGSVSRRVRNPESRTTMYLARAKIGALIFFSSIGIMVAYVVYSAVHRPLPDAWVTYSVWALCSIGFAAGLFIFLWNLHLQAPAEIEKLRRTVMEDALRAILRRLGR